MYPFLGVKGVPWLWGMMQDSLSILDQSFDYHTGPKNLRMLFEAWVTLHDLHAKVEGLSRTFAAHHDGRHTGLSGRILFYRPAVASMGACDL